MLAGMVRSRRTRLHTIITAAGSLQSRLPAPPVIRGSHGPQGVATTRVDSAGSGESENRAGVVGEKMMTAMPLVKPVITGPRNEPDVATTESSGRPRHEQQSGDDAYKRERLWSALSNDGDEYHRHGSGRSADLIVRPSEQRRNDACNDRRGHTPQQHRHR